MADKKSEKVDPNFEAVLTRMDAFIPVMVAHMQRDLEQSSARTAEFEERRAEAEAKQAEAEAEQAKHEAALKAEQLELAKAQTGLVNAAIGALAARINQDGDGAMETRELTEVVTKLQRGY